MLVTFVSLSQQIQSRENHGSLFMPDCISALFPLKEAPVFNMENHSTVIFSCMHHLYL